MEFLLYVNDKDEFAYARGTYEDLDNLLEPFTHNNIGSILNHIKNKYSITKHPNYDFLRKEYSNMFDWDSNRKVAEMIESIVKKKVSI
ncbi:hypothetical protein [Heyndrickxia sporothermodurans]|uniref:Uncharacterized protein n=2 Tax=Heyndrickxia TaxID=2837504 RepID=A0A150L7V4_9BACI|nr:hypothetical protein [Heyndrickxia sporothermodurans]KYD08076.1 hypothetical protein B4102_2865 [Heyndrickxia sporothermodurans]MED3656199.1 hypothetical protein [Heyndrickxia sporothermodurans]